ncbi:hypothetical protein DFP72DRAFT_1116543 [Ephemerocybe angulata]|uniref:Uncharacterized protein n=1 Tax=Ephemerocybe angulata TaxID=980116 RepID=A0A8H6M697_9AGAR|nr:hypothetical protein DFP72DRAFT_1116543 [Tulosesus angulatus]
MHLEKTIAQVPELATYLQKPVTLNEGNPHTLVIRRSPHVMAAFVRRNARSFAKLFWNRLFGSDEEAREMMGDARYQNALNALSARRAYDVGDVTIAYAVLEASMEATPAAPPVPTESSARGTKRKHT